MKYWISISIYLWRNIFNRWLESPLAPASKIILGFLLSLLAFIVIGLLRNTEDVLKDKFNQRDVLMSVMALHDIGQKDNLARLEKSILRESLFKKMAPNCEIDYIRRAGVTALDSEGERYPIAVCFTEPTFWKMEWGDFLRPEVYFFCEDSEAPDSHLEIWDVKFKPQRLSKTSQLTTLTKGKGMILLSYPMGKELLKPGFAETIVFRFNGVNEMKATHQKIEAYCAAEKINYSLFSALPLIAQLKTFSELQSYVRLGLAILIVTITIIVIGNQTILEFREQQYHFALLRSFGSPLAFIMTTELIEKVLLASLGVLLAYWSLDTIAVIIRGLGSDFAMVKIKLLADDVRLVLLGILGGVFVSWCFLLMIARKPIGLILS